jgi:hypothetical protein
MEHTSSGLSDLLASLPEPVHTAYRPFFKRGPSLLDLAPTEASPADYTCNCEHGSLLTEFQLRSIAALPNRWYAKHGMPNEFDCIFEAHREFFKLLDGKLRSIFPHGIKSTAEFRKAVEGLV